MSHGRLTTWKSRDHVEATNTHLQQLDHNIHSHAYAVHTPAHAFPTKYRNSAPNLQLKKRRNAQTPLKLQGVGGLKGWKTFKVAIELNFGLLWVVYPPYGSPSLCTVLMKLFARFTMDCRPSSSYKWLLRGGVRLGNGPNTILPLTSLSFCPVTTAQQAVRKAKLNNVSIGRSTPIVMSLRTPSALEQLGNLARHVPKRK